MYKIINIPVLYMESDVFVEHLAVNLLQQVYCGVSESYSAYNPLSAE